eukprot:TRINITY_DN52050_c0_g1_i1.p1 TRINITY_DN52050_c0_g1~~TRINITY_DN52050_c0_g1_i1.p1  ORF type:complete len:264 (+),score=23.53 TRINITY_DN52050_c0_g1_i1:134-925(+)
MEACASRSLCSSSVGLAKVASARVQRVQPSLVLRSSFRGANLSSSASKRPATVGQRHVVVQNGLFDFFTKLTGPKVSDEEREAWKEELLEAIAPLQRGLTATDEDKEAIDELAARLEAINPTRRPLASPLINGKWKLVYTTSDTILGTNKPFFLRPQGPIFQAIDAETLQARNMETWPFFNQVQATLTPTSDSSVDVKFDVFKILSLISIQAPDSARGTLDITYLDEDMRISRGNRGNLFVLIMDDSSFRIPLVDEVEEEEEE